MNFLRSVMKPTAQAVQPSGGADIPPASFDLQLPALPPLLAPDLILAFTSAWHAGGPKLNGTSLSPVDYTHLIFLGEGVLKYAVTKALFEMNPTLGGGKLTKLRKHFTSADALRYWAELYDNFDAPGTQARASETSPSSMHTVFTAYLGALYHQDGQKTVDEWVASLIAYTDYHNPDLGAKQSKAPSIFEPPSPSSISGVAGPSSGSGVAGPSSSDVWRPMAGTDTLKRTISFEDSAPVQKKVKFTYDGVSVSPEFVPSSSAALFAPRHDPPSEPAPQAETSVPSSSLELDNDVAPWRNYLAMLNEKTAHHNPRPQWDISSRYESKKQLWVAALTLGVLDMTFTASSSSKQKAKHEAARLACEKLKW